MATSGAIVVAVLSVGLLIGVLRLRGSLDRSTRSFVLGTMALGPPMFAADLLQLVQADPVAILVSAIFVLVALAVTVRALDRRWVEILCGTWLLAACAMVLALAWGHAIAPFSRAFAADVQILGVTLALFVAVTIHVTFHRRFTDSRTRALLFALLWARGTAWLLIGAGVVLDLPLAAGGRVAFAISAASGLALIAREARRSSYDERGRSRELPPLLLMLLAGAAVAAELYEAAIDVFFDRWSIYILTGGSAAVLLYWQVLVNRRLAQATKDANARERYFRTVVQDSTDVIIICDAQGGVEYLSPAAEHVFDGYATVVRRRPVPFQGRCADLLGASQDAVLAGLAECARTGRARIDGRRGTQVLEASVTRRDDEFVLSVRDVTEREQMRATLHALAFNDALTDLPNRNRLLHEAEQLVRSATGPVHALFIDLDRFKHINDAAGHRTGDRVLMQVAARLRAVVASEPRTAILARLGGDEFVIVLVADLDAALALAARVDEAISEPFAVDAQVFQIGASIGVAWSEGPAEAEDFLQRADLAMYQAKQLRRPCVVYEPSMSAAVREQADRDQEFATQWDREVMEIYLQPIVSTTSLAVHSVEALLRWRRADGGIVAPADALSFATRTGRQRQLTDWVVQKALRVLADSPGVPTPIAVNVPPSVLTRHDFADQLASRVAGLGLPPQMINLEITEDDVVEQGDSGLHALDVLRDKGFSVHVDDFGTGFSSLSYLIRLPVDGLKIDRTFTSEILESAAARSVVLGMVSLSREVGIDLIAEGVETREQHVELLRLGVPYAQGFWYAQPQPAGAIRDRSELSSWRGSRVLR